MTTGTVILINHLKVQPGNQAALLALLKANIDAVASKLAGWRESRLIAALDGSSVTIYSEWDSPQAVDAMRADPRMQACFPRIRELASFDSVLGHIA
ncbi:antibiotic biosynthesis monooxygenase [Duganella sp. Root1480D1]|uniref:antibiotic biosynthesis monooxygenase n=1 Tax=Duganella sp. Root1480D1 TaxID=1736471 RepID=UPI00070E1036|nr:antibiotic biosynthesis monooxygenase [Duganella sp. Root1480D1]KQZ40951.1 hypothetical protein ASD58_26655 [Duganella sp. Root1480D1]